jgi:GNAT superfamily N-acetyltransferase
MSPQKPSPFASFVKRCDQDLAAAIELRPATRADVPAIDAMHFLSVQALGAEDYSPAQIEAFIGHLGTYDKRLIDEGTYFVLLHGGHVVGSGGWSRHLPHAEGEQAGEMQQAASLAPNSAKVRSIFVHPKYARLGLGSRLVRHAEAEAAAAGFRLVELWATLTGVPLYRKLGYQEVSRFGIPVGNGATVAAVHMARILGADAASAA